MFYLINLLGIPFYYLVLASIYKDKKKRNNIFYLLLGLHLVLFKVLANPYNYADTEGYAIAYSNIADMSIDEAMSSHYLLWGPGYVFVNWIFTRVSSDPLFLFVLIGIITVCGVIWFYKKTSHSPLSTSLLYVLYPMMYLQSFSVLRQHLSIVFVLLAIYYIEKKLLSIPLAITAVLFHTSSIILIPFYIWKFFKIEKLGLIPLISVIIVGVVIMRLGMDNVLLYLERYQNEGFGEEGNNNTLPIILLGIMVLAYFLRGANKKVTNIVERNIFSFVIYGLMVSLFSYGLHGAGRLTLMFIYVIPVAISFFRGYSNKNRIFYYTVISVIFLLVISILIYTYTPERYVYVSLWGTVNNYK